MSYVTKYLLCGLGYRCHYILWFKLLVEIYYNEMDMCSDSLLSQAMIVVKQK